MRATSSTLCWAVCLCLISSQAISATDELLKACLGEKDSDKAIDTCAKAAERTTAAHDLARIFTRQCVAYAEKVNYTAAKQACNDAIKHDANNAIAFYDLGNVFMREQRYNEAIPFFDKATAIDKNYARAYNNKCYSYNYMKSYDIAVAECTKAIGADPRQPSFYVGRGNALLNKGDLQRAQADYLKARELDPDNQSALIGLAAAYQQGGDYKSAIKLLDMVKADETEDAATAYNNRCWARTLASSDKSELATALNDCNQALNLLPSADWILDSRALTYLKLGDLDKAAEDYKQALILDPTKVSSLYGYGLILQKRGDGRADGYIKKAVAADRNIAEEFKKYGVNSL